MNGLIIVVLWSGIQLGIIFLVLIIIGLTSEGEELKKCPVCLSCLRDVWVGNNYYKYCTLCQVVYKISFEGLTKVTESGIIEAVKEIFGTRVN